MKKAIENIEQKFESRDLEDLKKLVRIPSVSFDGFPKEKVKESAQAVADMLKRRGLENVQILTIGNAHPYVYAERLKAPGRPTLLLYAHHDVQPPGRPEIWKTDPFEPVVKPGPGGDRLWGRGTADDKAGIIVHASAISAYLETVGELPVNVKVVIEGEEEIGSEHLEEFLKTHRKMLDADILVLTDTGNFDCGVPSLTVGLRGLTGVEIEVRALTKTVHSGMWGGPIPDPAMALTKMLSGLVDEKGHITIPGVMEQVIPPSKTEIEEFKRVPYNEAEFREQSGLIPQARMFEPCIGTSKDISPLIQTWRLPSLTINGIQASSRAQPGNIICDVAWAKVTIRLVAGMDPDKTLEILKDHLRKLVPWGLSVEFKSEAAGPSWSTEPVGPAFDLARKALKAGYGKDALMIATGGSIPFVKPFAEALGGAPALLIGVEDPYTNAHGENESLLISDLKKACLAQAHLFAELGENYRK